MYRCAAGISGRVWRGVGDRFRVDIPRQISCTYTTRACLFLFSARVFYLSVVTGIWHAHSEVAKKHEKNNSKNVITSIKYDAKICLLVTDSRSHVRYYYNIVTSYIVSAAYTSKAATGAEVSPLEYYFKGSLSSMTVNLKKMFNTLQTLIVHVIMNFILYYGYERYILCPPHSLISFLYSNTTPLHVGKIFIIQ